MCSLNLMFKNHIRKIRQCLAINSTVKLQTMKNYFLTNAYKMQNFVHNKFNLKNDSMFLLASLKKYLIILKTQAKKTIVKLNN